jgi:hypothetical protein
VVLMMVTNVLGEQSLQVAFIQRNHVVQERDELLTQSETLKKESSPLTKEAHQHPEAERDEAKHGLDL